MALRKSETSVYEWTINFALWNLHHDLYLKENVFQTSLHLLFVFQHTFDTILLTTYKVLTLHEGITSDDITF